jgi:hypothetical protein
MPDSRLPETGDSGFLKTPSDKSRLPKVASNKARWWNSRTCPTASIIHQQALNPARVLWADWNGRRKIMLYFYPWWCWRPNFVIRNTRTRKKHELQIKGVVIFAREDWNLCIIGKFPTAVVVMSSQRAFLDFLWQMFRDWLCMHRHDYVLPKFAPLQTWFFILLKNETLCTKDEVHDHTWKQFIASCNGSALVASHTSVFPDIWNVIISGNTSFGQPVLTAEHL